MEKSRKKDIGTCIDRDNKNDIASSEHCSTYGEINFIQNKTKRKIKYIIKGLSFFMIASFSGAITADYIVERKYSKINLGLGSNVPIVNSNIDEGMIKKYEVPKNDINIISEETSQYIVGVSTKEDAFSNNTINKELGSGIVFDSKGYILTSGHLIEGAGKIFVKLPSYATKPVKAKLIGIDSASDLAVIKIDVENLPVARFADSSKVKVGDLAVALGNANGEDSASAVSLGVISTTNRKMEVVDPKTSEKNSYKIFKTDAKINFYNNGGALCNYQGEIIGINSFKLTQEYNTEDMGIAICINEAKQIAQSLINYGTVKRPDLGFQGAGVNLENKGIEGVYVQEVYPGRSLANAGVRPTDIIVELGGNKLKKLQDIQTLMENYKVGDTIEAKIWRNGNIEEVKIVITDRK